jgi:dipeptidyl-peptidase 4
LPLEQLTEDRELDVEISRATQLTRADRSYEGHRTVTCEVKREMQRRMIAKGSYVLRLAQPLGNLALQLLEPNAEDGLVSWNFFDSPMWESGDEYPVLRLVVPVELPLTTVESIVPAQEIDLHQIYGPERRVNFAPPFPFGIRWLPQSSSYLQQMGGTWMRVDAETGARTRFYDPQPVISALEKLSELSPEDATRMAQDLGELSPAADALLTSHGGDLYYARLDGSVARRLTFEPGAERLATFSPNGKLVAFIRDYNLHVVDVESGRQWPLTSEGDQDHLYGLLDWVYQEEIYGRGNYKGFWWSPDSQHLALLALDQSPVHRYTVTDHTPYRQSLEITRYPKAGDPLPQVRLGLVSAAGGSVRWLEDSQDSAAEKLIVRVGFHPASHSLYYQVQNREQTWLELRKAAVRGGDSQVVVREAGNGWIDPLIEPIWLKDGSFLWLSGRSGHTHIYRVSDDGQTVGPVTRGPWEVRTLHGSDPAGKWAYFQAAIDHPTREQAYRVDIAGGTLERLTDGQGSHSARFNDSFSHFLDSYSGIHQPPAMQVCRHDGTRTYIIAPYVDDHLKYYRFGPPEYHAVPVRDGYELDAWLMKPAGTDEPAKLPLLCYVYGGPQAPMVRDRWTGSTYLWHQFLAQQGIGVWISDNRASSLHGIGVTRTVHRRLGNQELQDLEDGLDWLSQHAPWVDTERVGMWGWSYGGYFTAYAMTHSQRFAAGVAGAPVTDWRNYDAIYTERLMGLPQDNPAGYEQSSVVAAADRLHGRLLLIHGEVDDNVHLANTLQLARALQRAGKQFDMMIYPQNQHSITQTEQSRHLQQLMTQFWLDNLRPGGAASK